METLDDITYGTCITYFLKSLGELNSLNSGYADDVSNSVCDDEAVPPADSAEEQALSDQVVAQTELLRNQGFSEVPGASDQNALEKNFSIEFQDTYLFSEDLRFVSGFGITQHQLDSITFMNGGDTSTVYRLFGNTEKRWNQWVFNIGAMFEHNDDVLDKPAFSPRLGANYRLNEHSNIRFILSRAVKIPDLLDYELDWSYQVEGQLSSIPDELALLLMDQAHIPISNSHNTESEKILAREISLYTKKRFLYSSGYMDFNSDVKFFYNSVTEKPEFYDFNDPNIPSTFHTTLKGFEVDVNASLNDLFSGTLLNNIDFHLNYTYLDHDPDIPARKSFVPRHYGSVYSIVDFKDDWFSTISYYGNSAMGKKKERIDS